MIDAICSEWTLDLRSIRFPEDERPPPDRPLDAIALTDRPALALEHTLHQSFPDQVARARWFRPLQSVCADLAGQLPGPGRYELSVSADVIEGHGNTDLRTLVNWIRTTAPQLTAGRTAQGPTNVARAEPPIVPFPVMLLRTEQWEGVPEGALDVRWPIDFDRLPAARLDQMVNTLSRKLPKLEEHRPTGGRTVLLLENQDIQLVSPDNVTESVRIALEMTALPTPDAIVMANLIGGSAGLSWLKDGDLWHPDLANRYWVPMTMADDID